MSVKFLDGLFYISEISCSGASDFGFSDGRGSTAPSGGGPSGGASGGGGGLSLGEQFLNLVNDTIGPEDFGGGAPQQPSFQNDPQLGCLSKLNFNSCAIDKLYH